MRLCLWMVAGTEEKRHGTRTHMVSRERVTESRIYIWRVVTRVVAFLLVDDGTTTEVDLAARGAASWRIRRHSQKAAKEKDEAGLQNAHRDVCGMRPLIASGLPR